MRLMISSLVSDTPIPQPKNISYKTPRKNPIEIAKMVPKHQSNYFNLKIGRPQL